MKLNIWIILATMHTSDFTKTTARSDAEPRIQSFVGSCLHIFKAHGYQKRSHISICEQIHRSKYHDQGMNM